MADDDNKKEGFTTTITKRAYGLAKNQRTLDQRLNIIEARSPEITAAVSGFRMELDEAKKIIVPSEKDFYNLNRQIENLNQRISLLENNNRQYLRDIAVAIIMTGALSAIITILLTILSGC